MVRAKLEPIDALLSQWSKKYCQGTLEKPIAADSNNDRATKEDHEDCADCNDNEYQSNLLSNFTDK